MALPSGAGLHQSTSGFLAAVKVVKAYELSIKPQLECLLPDRQVSILESKDRWLGAGNTDSNDSSLGQ